MSLREKASGLRSLFFNGLGHCPVSLDIEVDVSRNWQQLKHELDLSSVVI